MKNFFRYDDMRAVVTGARSGMGEASDIGGDNLYTDARAGPGVLNRAINGALMVPDDYNNEDA